MTASEAQIAQVRRMVAEPTEITYSDELLTAIIEAYPVADANGNLPDEEDWVDTYDLAAAAAQVWAEKAATLASNFDFDADGAAFKRSQAYEQLMRQARYWSARRVPGTITLRPEPRPEADKDDTSN